MPFKKSKSSFGGVEYQEFECNIGYSTAREGFDCELFSQVKRLEEKEGFFGSKKHYRGGSAFGGHWPTTQTLYDDPCSYDDFELVVQFAKNAIASGGIANMKKRTHNVNIEMPDFLVYEKTGA